MIYIGICDDSQEARFLLSVSLERLLENRAVEYNLYEFSSGEGFLKWYEKHSAELDLLFLDIEMTGLSGMETAKILREKNSLLQIVFVTSHPAYVFDGYSVGALGYLLKPAKEEQLNDIITRALVALRSHEEEVFFLKNKDGLFRVPKKSILYFYSEGRLVHCVTDKQTYGFYEKLNVVEQEIGSPFVRIHQRYLVNANKVEQIRPDFVSIPGEELPISRSFQEKALLALSRNLLK